MNALIIYHSQQHGNTGKMAETVAEGFGEGATLWNTNEERFDVIAVGTPDYFSYMTGP